MFDTKKAICISIIMGSISFGSHHALSQTKGRKSTQDKKAMDTRNSNDMGKGKDGTVLNEKKLLNHCCGNKMRCRKDTTEMMKNKVDLKAIQDACNVRSRIQKLRDNSMPFDKRTVRSLLTGLYLGLSDDDIYKLTKERFEYNITLEEAYNKKIVGGNGLKKAGETLIGAGAGLIVLGAIVAAFSLQTSESETYQDSLFSWNDVPPYRRIEFIVGAHFFSIGGLWLLVGIPLYVTGKIKMEEWIDYIDLDSVPLNELERVNWQSSKKGPISKINLLGNTKTGEVSIQIFEVKF